MNEIIEQTPSGSRKLLKIGKGKYAVQYKSAWSFDGIVSEVTNTMVFEKNRRFNYNGAGETTMPVCYESENAYENAKGFYDRMMKAYS